MNRFLLSCLIPFIGLYSSAQTTITLKKENGKVKNINIDNILAVESDTSIVFGQVVKVNGSTLQVINSDYTTSTDSLLEIDLLAVNKLWICPKRKPNKCSKWETNRYKNENVVKKINLGLFVASMVSGNNIKLTGAFILAGGLLFTVTGIKNNPRRLSINKKWQPITEFTR